MRAENITSAEDCTEAGMTRVFYGVASICYVSPDPSAVGRAQLDRWVADFGGVIAPYVP